MSELFLTCEKCHADVPVEPLETVSYRSVSCNNCGAELPFLNSELKTRPAAQPAPGILIEGSLTVQQTTRPSASPGNVGHWNHPDRE
jgi:hypothetical protein